MLGEGAKDKSPYPYDKLPRTPTPNPLRGKKSWLNLRLSRPFFVPKFLFGNEKT